MRLITKEMLRDACPEELRHFLRLFPKGAKVTRANALKAAKKNLDFLWLDRHLLPPAMSRSFEAAYDRTDNRIYKQYDRLEDLVDKGIITRRQYNKRTRRLDLLEEITPWLLLLPYLRRLRETAIPQR